MPSDISRGSPGSKNFWVYAQAGAAVFVTPNASMAHSTHSNTRCAYCPHQTFCASLQSGIWQFGHPLALYQLLVLHTKQPLSTAAEGTIVTTHSTASLLFPDLLAGVFRCRNSGNQLETNQQSLENLSKVRMAADDPSGGDAPAPAANGGGAGQVALLSDPVDVIIDKLLRCVIDPVQYNTVQ